MRSPTELELDDCGYGFPKTAPTNLEIKEFEEAVGGKLPNLYLEMLKHRNGGNPGLCLVVPESNDEESYLHVEVVFALNGNRSYEYNVWSYYNIVKDLVPKGFFPIAHDQGGDLFFLDVRNDGSSVHWAPQDLEFRKMILVARSFQMFLDGLRPYRDLPLMSEIFETGPDGLPRLKREFREER